MSLKKEVSIHNRLGISLLPLKLTCLFFFLAGCQNPVTSVSSDTNTSADMLSFASADELLTTISTIKADSSLKARRSIDKLNGFTSMLDSFPPIDDFDNQTELDNYLAQATDYVSVKEVIASDGNIVRAVNLKIRPEFAAVVNTSGMIKVDDQVYNLLDTTEAHQLETKLDSASKKARILFTIGDGSVILIPMWGGAHYRQ